MEPETKSSSSAQSSLWPLALLGILFSTLALCTSKRYQSRESLRQQGHPGQTSNSGEKDVSIIQEVMPTPPEERITKTTCRPDQTPWLKTMFEGIAILVTIGLLYFNFRQARATEQANKNTLTALTVSEQAHVTIGRPDGVAADIIMPTGSNNKAGILVYFQNTGHLPAKFNWGQDSPIIEVMPQNPNIRTGDWGPGPDITFQTDHSFRPMWRAKSRKNAQSFGLSGTVEIAGNSTYQGVLWELPKERILQLMNWDRPFAPNGTFDYCDGFGDHVCRNFTLRYAGDPYNRFFLANEDECPVWEMQVLNPDPNLEYLSPCEVQEGREELKGTIKSSPKP